MNHPSENQLLDYADNKLTEKEQWAVERHIQFCDDCMTRVNMIQNLPTTADLSKINAVEEQEKRVRKILEEHAKEKQKEASWGQISCKSM